MDAPPQFPPGTVIGGDYRIERPLSQGGMGAVYVAEQLSTGKPRALKLMHPQLVTDPKSRVRFIDEARVGSKIPSEHIVEVVGAGVDEASGVPFLAMELLEGEDLSAVIERSGALPVASVRELMLQLGHALGAAHERGVVHRDLKPENVFIARSRRRGSELMVKVLDFGIAKTLESNRTAATATAAMGSPLFMSPEQATPGAAIRPETDVWALGLIAFHALTGRFYWRSAELEPFNIQSLLAEVLIHPLAPASARAGELGVGATLPPGFDGWFDRCVTRDPSSRYANAAACLDGFESMMQGNLHPSPPAGVGFAATMQASATPPPNAMTPNAMTPAPFGSTPSFGGASSAGGAGSTPAYGSGPGGFGSTPGPGLGSSPGAFGSSPAPVAPTAFMQPMGSSTMQPQSSGGSRAPLLLGLLGCGGVLAAFSLIALVLITQTTAAPPDPPSSSPPRDFAPTPPTPQDPALDPLAPSSPQAPPPLDPSQPHGTLRINTRPWATAYLDGRPIGLTPLVVDAAVGDHTLRLVTDEGGDVTETVSVRADEVTTIVRQVRVSDTPSASSLPAHPSRSDISTALQSVSGAVSACSRGMRGVLTARVTFRGSTGGVSSATMMGGSISSEERGCMQDAIRAGARVPPFSSETFRLSYPFRI